MCELLALSFANPVSADFSLREFAARGEENPDGWGLAWFPDGGRSVAVVKEPVKWTASHTAGFLAANPTLCSRIHLAHVRHKTVGAAPNHADTHPFTRELAGRDYVFAHNGTLEGPAWDPPLGRFHPVGATDSERFFCHLMHELSTRAADSPLATAADWAWLHGKLAATNRFGKLNVLLTDGDRLFIYHDVNGWKGLNWRRVHVREGEPRHFGDDDLAIALDSPEGEAKSNTGFVVATRPLSPTGWHSFQRGELIVFERGQVVYSSHRDIGVGGFAVGDPGLSRVGSGERPIIDSSDWREAGTVPLRS